MLRFHARWHRGEVGDHDRARFVDGGDRWPDWPLLLTEGSGRFCGAHLHVYNTWRQPAQRPATWWYGRWDAKTVDWWWGEGDETFFVDGESVPSTFGTGSEDCVGYAWAAEPPFPMFDSAVAAQPFVELDANGHTSVSRFHIADDVAFSSSFAGFLEKYKDDVGTGRTPVCTPQPSTATGSPGPRGATGRTRQPNGGASTDSAETAVTAHVDQPVLAIVAVSSWSSSMAMHVYPRSCTSQVSWVGRIS